MKRHEWPVQPLLDLPGVTPRKVQRTLNLSPDGWAKALAQGLTDWQADRAAIRLGQQPQWVWGPAYDEVVLTELDRDYLAGGWRQAWLWAGQQALPLDSPEVAA